MGFFGKVTYTYLTNSLYLTSLLYITNISFSTSNFYGLPKAQKSKQINTAIQEQNNQYIEIHELEDLTVTPIVSKPNCSTRSLSQLIGIIFKPFLIPIKRYVKDNLDFLRKCSRKNNESITVVTFDKKSLYTSIPHSYGLEAISFWIEKHPDSLHSRFPKGFVLETIKIILENNNCTFNDGFYRQISGTTMGTTFAPTYATLTMEYFEVHFYSICKLKWRKEFQQFILRN